MRYNIHHISASLVLRHKHVYADGAIVEIKIWRVPKSVRTPEGIKYPMVYIDNHGNRVLGYDNAEGKSHHKHDHALETPLKFESIDQLMEQFLLEIGRIRSSRP